MVTDEEILRMTKAGESQSVEFKETLSSQHEGTRSLVAFANRDGGRVLFGVANDGRLRGIEVGTNTMENLANFVTSHTYPSLPVHLESVDVAGKSVILAESVADRPPAIGIYMFSSEAMSPDESVDTAQLHALRRVGRTNQEVDIMWLRPDMPSDPKLRLSTIRRWSQAEVGLPKKIGVRVWVEDRSATAHQIALTTDPERYATEEALDDLPVPYMSHATGGDIGGPRPPSVAGWQMFHELVMEALAEENPDPFAIVATYSDDVGILWESKRSIASTQQLAEDGRRFVQLTSGPFQRRVRRFPPKRGV